MNLDRIFDHALAAHWSSEIRAIYRDFSERLMRRAALPVKICKGGLHYYQITAGGPIFVYHLA